MKLDYALNKGFMCPSYTTKLIGDTFGSNAIGIYIRWFGEAQEQLPIKQLNKLYINHDLGKEDIELKNSEIIKILNKYYSVLWDYSNEKTILIKEKETKK
ncbi:MAG: hypothetical protein U1C51_05650 [Candidatus Izemoplasmatales bacterium]|nr:hypothetical protein [Candidatus Izemoplasmatales bacterium]